jgi:hypothetical protein
MVCIPHQRSLHFVGTEIEPISASNSVIHLFGIDHNTSIPHYLQRDPLEMFEMLGMLSFHVDVMIVVPIK